MKEHGLGITSDSIRGAEILNQVFSKHGITPQTVEQFHRRSDIKGFFDMLHAVDPEIAKNILKAGIASDPQLSFKKLGQII